MGKTQLHDHWPKLPIAAVVFMLPLRALTIPGMGGATPGLVLALALVPIVWSAARMYRVGWTVGLFLASLLSVPFLLALSSAKHEVDMSATIGYVVILVSALVTYVSLLCSRNTLGLRATALLYSAGWIAQYALSSSSWDTNAWKYAFAWPTAIFLGALIYDRSRFLSLLLVVALSLMAIINDLRSHFGLLLLVGVTILLLWNRKKAPSGPKIFALAVTMSGLLWAIYAGSVWLALNGYLGLRNQMVTAAQIARNENLLTSGRVETSAAFNLFLHNPIGYGPGVVPNGTDILIAKTGLQMTGVNPESDYVNSYILGDQIKLHSVGSDLWVSFGLAGLILAAYFAWLILTRLVIGQGRLTMVYVFASFIALWDIGFSPIMSNIHEVIFAAALATPLLNERHETSAISKEHESAVWNPTSSGSEGWHKPTRHETHLLAEKECSAPLIPDI